MEIKLSPYLYFHGNAEAALETYRKIFGGRVEILQRYDHPAMNAPKEDRQKISHAVFYFGDNVLYACDILQGIPGQSYPEIALNITLPDAQEAGRIFAALVEGGKIFVPFSKQFWGASHGNGLDKYGVRWMVQAVNPL